MNRSGPIIIIEDDPDDQEILEDVFRELEVPNKIIFFLDGQKALDYLNGTDLIPFLILSDINMPRLDGFALRDKIKMDADLQLRCIPYIYFTTASTQQMVIEAYSKSVQGFFIKQSSVAEIKRTIEIIIEYWKRCSSPNNFSK